MQIGPAIITYGGIMFVSRFCLRLCFFICLFVFLFVFLLLFLRFFLSFKKLKKWKKKNKMILASCKENLFCKGSVWQAEWSHCEICFVGSVFSKESRVSHRCCEHGGGGRHKIGWEGGVSQNMGEA